MNHPQVEPRQQPSTHKPACSIHEGMILLSAPGRVTILALLFAGTLCVAAVVGTHKWRIGVRGEWEWPYYAQPAPWQVVSPAILCAVLLVVVLAGAIRRGVVRGSHEAILVAVSLALSLGITLNLGKAGPTGPYEAVPVTSSPWISGYFGEAVRINDLGLYLERYAERIRGLKVNDPYGHLADHPAGPVVFHWAVNRAMESLPALARWFTPSDQDMAAQARQLAQLILRKPISDGQFAGIWGSALLFRLALCLALIPLYLLARDLCCPEGALLALALAALTPSLHLFGPYPDQLFPLFAMGAVWAWHRALRSGDVSWAAASGFVSAAGLMFSLSLLAGVALLGLWALLTVWDDLAAGKGPNYARWLRVIAAWVAGFVVCSLLPMALFGYDTWGVWRICLSQHATFATVFPRSYGSWALFNPIEFAVFAGFPTFALFMASGWMDLMRWRREWRRAGPSALPWALLGVLAALDLSGKNLGEVARLWMFLMPLAALPAGCVLVGLDRKAGWVAGAVLALGTLQLVVFRLHLNVFGL